ncbi:PREDICTED: glycophorin-A isoform X2 [Miniopterus natalensis]|uniref:glycophorin-A isoform X2 n=1 Tax=Miniopterus natalensis TaxID=291302 RepID=UPI0007A6D0B9|nr:PREDICTED: glycophorin-A isoform X2 [Miniopterus natalensis]
MYKKIIVVLLLSGYVCATTLEPAVSIADPGERTLSSEIWAVTERELHEATPTAYQRPREVSTTRGQPVENGGGERTRKQITHAFSEPVIIAIIFGVIAGVVGIILLFVYAIGKLTKKRSVDIQPSLSHDTDVPLSSVETGNPEE